MSDDEFQWDDGKAAANYADHGVTFEAAREAFKDPFALDWLDDREPYGEDRYALIGMAEGRSAVCRLYHEGRHDPDHIGQRSRAP